MPQPPRRIQGPDGNIHEFPSDFTDADIESALASVAVSDTPDAAPETPKGSAAGAHARVGQAVTDLAIGAGKKLVETGLRGGALLRKIPGVNALDSLMTPVDVNTTPSNTMQSVGGMVEQGAEMFNPSRLITKGGLALAGKVAPKLAPYVGGTAAKVVPQAVAEGAGAAAIAKAQGSTDVQAGVSGALTSTLPTIGQQAVKIAKQLRAGAVKDVEKFFHPTTKPLKGVLAKRMPEILQRRGEVLGATGRSRETALDVFGAEREVAGEAVDEALSVYGSRDITDAPKRLIAALDKAKAPYERVKKVTDLARISPEARKFVRQAADGSFESAIPLNPRKIRQIESLKEIVSAHGDTMNVDELVGLRRAWDEVAYERAGTTLDTVRTKAEKWSKKMGGDAIRAILDTDTPELADINRAFSFWKDLDTVMSETALRKVGQTGGLGKLAAETGGRILGGATGASGGVGGAVGGAMVGGQAAKMLQRVVESPRYASLSANLKTKIADAIMREDKGLLFRYLAEASARLGAVQAPRAFGSAPAQ